MAKKKIFILLGHPDTDTSCGYFASQYEDGAKEGGHEVRRMNVGDMKFDPILHKGYKVIQELEPDLKTFQECVKWCDHFVLIYPSWWSQMPALLKGLFDRAWLPHFAYHFRQKGFGWVKLLKGRSANVVVTSDSHPWISRFLFGDNVNEIEWGILWFSGISPVRITKIGPMKDLTPEKREKFAQKMWRLGRKGK